MNNIRTFDDLYLHIAKMRPNDQKHIMMCLRNRRRQLEKEMAATGIATKERTLSKSSLVV